jgi:hypothetical protein
METNTLNKTEAKNMSRRQCTNCNCFLRRIGVDRKNGKTHFKDWGKRDLCIKCFKNKSVMY